MTTRRQLFSGAAATAVATATVAVLDSGALAQDASPVASPVTTFSDSSREVFQTLLDGVANGDYPGIVIYAQSAGEVVHEAAGVANVETQEPLDKNAVFQIGSNTKMMTAAIVLQLQEEGLLDIDVPVATWLPDVATKFPGDDQLTVRMLLNHTSGLYDYVEDLAAAIFSEWFLTKNTTPLTQAWTPQQIVDYTSTYRAGNAYFPPGNPDSWQYSNTDYVLLGLLIEQLTGKSYSDNLQQRIFDPLGLSQTKLQDGVWDGTVSGYYQKPFDFDTSDWNLSQGWAAGAVSSTPQELAIFLRALLHGDLFAKPETLTLMKTTVNAPALLASYGLGLVSFGGSTWGHGGQTLGFYSQAFYDEAKDVVFIAWINSATPSFAIAFVSIGGALFD